MSLHYVQGDLFVNRYNAQALAHGCNCIGVMGAGIAVEFKQRYPEMYRIYRVKCFANPRLFNPGDVMLWREDDKPFVLNLATQENITSRRATYDGLRTCLIRMIEVAQAAEITSIAMPLIGAGYGGLMTQKVRIILEQLASRSSVFFRLPEWSGDLYVYNKYVKGA